MSDDTQPNIVAVIAGSGQFPVLFIKNAIKNGSKVIAICHISETDSSVEDLGASVFWIKLGQLGKIISILKNEKVQKVAFAGGISRPNILKGNVWPDLKGLALISKIKSVKDDVLLRAVANEIEKNGIKVISGTEFLPDCIPKKGSLTTRDLTKEERECASIGWDAAKLIGSIEIGQTVVVVNKMIVAVEAIEGTDATLKRAGDLAHKKGGVVVKVSKPQQDKRLDLPTIGIDTIRKMKECGLTALVIEAGNTLLLQPMELVEEANRFKIAIEAL
ncbi:MAG: UDP-2,3-diacylglucosamine diphosphatase LpxI [bacterium]|nr:UDP-2,3-diacylglucosamine diphosphatase LpxI [bacterium]